MTESRLHRWIRLASSMLASLLLQARNLVVSLVVFRWFDNPTSLWGAVNQTSAVVTLLAIFAHLGLDFTAVQLVSKYRDDAAASALSALRITSVLRVVATLLVAAPLLFAPAFVGPLVGMGDVPQLVAAGGALLISTSFYEFSTYLVSATDDFVSMAWTRFVFTVVNIGLIVLVASGGYADPAQPIVLAQSVAGFAATAAVLPAIRKQMLRLATRARSQEHTGPGPRELVRAAIAFALPMTLVSASGRLFNYADRVLLPVLASREALGSYTVAGSVISAALFATYAFRNVARTKLPNERLRSPERARATLLATYRTTNFVAVWIAAGAIGVAPQLVVLVYGPDASDAAAMLPWFTPFVIATAHASFSATALVAADEPKVYTRLTIWMLLVNLVLNLVLIPIFEGYGSLAAMTLSTIPLALWSYREVARAYGDDLWSWASVRASMRTVLGHAVVGLIASVVGVIIAQPSWFSALLAGVVLSVIMAVGAKWTGDYASLRHAA